MSDGDSRTLERTPETAQVTARELVDPMERSLHHFRVVGRLGEGGMGVVYKAIDDKLRRAVAIKVLAPRYVVDERNKELILREARSAAALSHPNIAAIYEVHDQPEAFYVMELVEGDTLRARIDCAGKLPIDDALRWAIQIARALARAHAAGVVHRDLKADNVMVTTSDDIKLLDFGLAKLVDVAEPIAGDRASAFGPTVPTFGSTEHGRVMGTPAYMAPEQARGEDIDARVDVFAFGVLLYEMITGRAPFLRRDRLPSGDAASGDWKVTSRVRELVPRAPRAVEAMIARCLAFERADRFADGTALVTALEALRARRRIGWTMLGALCVLACTLVIGRLAGTSDDGVARCDAAAAIDARWTPAARTALEPRLPRAFATDDLAAFDQFATDWKAIHHAACIGEATPDTHASGEKQLACLSGALDLFTAALDRKPFPLEPDARPPLPSLDRCRGPAFDHDVAEHVIGETTYIGYAYALSPDGSSYAVLGDGRLAVKSVDGRELATLPVGGVTLVGWQPRQILLRDNHRIQIASLESGTLAPGPALPNNTMAVSPDGTYALVTSNDRFDVISLRDQTTSRLPVPVSDAYEATWSPDGAQIAIMSFRKSAFTLRVVDIATGHATALPLRVDNSLVGGAAVTWLNSRVLLFSGRVELDQGAGVWAAPFRAGALDGPVALVLPAARDTSYAVKCAAAGRMIADRIGIHHELSWLHDGQREAIKHMSSVRWLSDLSPDGGQLTVVRDADSGILSLADGSYTKLSDRIEWLRFDGDTLVSIEGDRLQRVDRNGGHHELARLDHPGTMSTRRPGPVRCAAEPGHCALMGQVGEHWWLAPLLPAGLGKATEIAEDVENFAVSSDGHYAAITAVGHVDVVDLATGKLELWPMANAACPNNQFVAWDRHTEAIYVTAVCDNGNAESQVFRVEHGKPPRLVYASTGWLGGIVVAPNGDQLVNYRQMTSNVVLIDGL